MTKLLFFGLGHLSRGDVSIAADVARQLPRSRFQVAFLTAAEVAAQVRDLGIPVLPLDGGSAAANLAIVDRIVGSYRPDLLVAADAFTLNYSVAWSGLSIRLLRERYGLPVASFDQYDWRAADYLVDFYGHRRTRFPKLLELCDLLIRNCPLNRPAAGEERVVVAALNGGGLRDGGLRQVHRPAVTARSGDRPLVFLANSRWEYVNVNRRADTTAIPQLVEAMPRVIHSHLAALGRPLRVVHVGPVPWRFPVAEQIGYRHLPKLPPGSFQEQLLSADLFITTNVVSVTLSQAILAGVPALVLNNDATIDLTGAAAGTGELAWLRAAAPDLERVYPFRVCPWGWYDFLTPVLRDNPYQDCFLTAGAFDRASVLAALAGLLDSPAQRTALHERQLGFRDLIGGLPPAADALDLAVASR